MAAGNGTIGDQSSCDVLGYQQATMVLVPVFYSLVFIFSLVGNVLVLVVICRGRQKLNSTAVYLLNLALSDCLFTLTLPGRIVYYILGFDWPFGDLLCRISTLLFFTNTYAGIGFMTCISLDRYLAVVHPQRLHCLRRVKMARWICCLVWALVSAQVAPVLFRNLLQHHEGRRTCMEYFDLNSSQWMPYFLILGCVISFCCPLAAILASYVSVHLKLRAAAERNPASRKNQRTNVIILLILITFIVCFSPYHLNVMQFMCRSIHHKVSCEELRGFKLSSQITVLLMNFNCCLDPFIYFFAIKTHKEMLSLFKDRLCPSSNATSSERAKNTSSNS